MNRFTERQHSVTVVEDASSVQHWRRKADMVLEPLLEGKGIQILMTTFEELAVFLTSLESAQKRALWVGQLEEEVIFAERKHRHQPCTANKYLYRVTVLFPLTVWHRWTFGYVTHIWPWPP